MFARWVAGLFDSDDENDGEDDATGLTFQPKVATKKRVARRTSATSNSRRKAPKEKQWDIMLSWEMISDLLSVVMNQSNLLMTCASLSLTEMSMIWLHSNVSPSSQLTIDLTDTVAFEAKIHRFFRPDRADRNRNGTSLYLPWGYFQTLFLDKENIPRTYSKRCGEYYVKMVFRSPEPLDSILQSGWHRQVWKNPASGTIISDREIQFYTEDEVMYIILYLWNKLTSDQVNNLRRERRSKGETMSFAPNTFCITYSIFKRKISFSMDVVDHVKKDKIKRIREKRDSEDITIIDGFAIQSGDVEIEEDQHETKIRRDAKRRIAEILCQARKKF